MRSQDRLKFGPLTCSHYSIFKDFEAWRQMGRPAAADPVAAWLQRIPVYREHRRSGLPGRELCHETGCNASHPKHLRLRGKKDIFDLRVNDSPPKGTATKDILEYACIHVNGTDQTEDLKLQTQSSQLVSIISRPVDETAMARARLHLIDWIGCAMAGSREGAAAVFQRLVSKEPVGPCFTIQGVPRHEAAAAFYNGTLGNLLEMDDTDRLGLVHPGDVIIPAVLASAQTEGSSGRDVLAAIVRGYEAMIRIARAVGPKHYAFWHNTSTCGPFGAAAGVASILGLDESATAHALGHAGSMSAGLWQMRHEATVTKQIHTANAARSGLTAARVAALGGAGPLTILDGPQGFFAATCPDGNIDAITADPTADWRIWETTFKPWPSCRHSHCAIEAALALRGRASPEAIDRIILETFNDAIVFCDRRDPTTPGQARFSLQHVLAVTLSKGAPEIADCEAPGLSNAGYAGLRNRTEIIRSAECDSRYPAHMSARLRLVLKDGSQLEHEAIDALGDPEKPLDSAGVASKARALMTHAGLSDTRIDSILNLLGSPELAFDLSVLAGLLGDDQART